VCAANECCSTTVFQVKGIHSLQSLVSDTLLPWRVHLPFSSPFWLLMSSQHLVSAASLVLRKDKLDDAEQVSEVYALLMNAVLVLVGVEQAISTALHRRVR
jgi:hypothetical protein